MQHRDVEKNQRSQHLHLVHVVAIAVHQCEKPLLAAYKAVGPQDVAGDLIATDFDAKQVLSHDVVRYKHSVVKASEIVVYVTIFHDTAEILAPVQQLELRNAAVGAIEDDVLEVQVAMESDRRAVAQPSPVDRVEQFPERRHGNAVPHHGFVGYMELVYKLLETAECPSEKFASH